MRRQEELRRMEELHNQEMQKRKEIQLRLVWLPRGLSVLHWGFCKNVFYVKVFDFQETPWLLQLVCGESELQCKSFQEYLSIIKYLFSFRRNHSVILSCSHTGW